MKNIQRVLLILIVIAVQVAAVRPALAANELPQPTGPLNITISPHAQNIVTKPGVPVTATFKVRNNGPQTEYLKAVIKTFGATGEEGTPSLRELTPKDEFGQWIQLSQPTFVAETNVWQTFSVTIKPPITAAFGYYYAIDFTRANQAKTTKGNSIFLTVSGLVLLDVQAPGEKREATLERFSASTKFTEFLPVKFNVKMRNSGNVHVSPFGNIFIYKGKKSVGIIDVNPGGGNILPNSHRVFNTNWDDGTPVYKTDVKTSKDGTQTEATELKWDNFKASKLRFGKYRAELQMVYNNGQYDVPLTAEVSFWVLPTRILVALAAVALLILAGLWMVVLRPIYRSMRQGKGGRRNGRYR